MDSPSHIQQQQQQQQQYNAVAPMRGHVRSQSLTLLDDAHTSPLVLDTSPPSIVTATADNMVNAMTLTSMRQNVFASAAAHTGVSHATATASLSPTITALIDMRSTTTHDSESNAVQ
jgi:hypothetical protein